MSQIILEKWDDLEVVRTTDDNARFIEKFMCGGLWLRAQLARQDFSDQRRVRLAFAQLHHLAFEKV